MDLKTRLESHPVSVLKKEISKTNVKGYSRMKKNEVVALMLKNKERFDYIPHAGKKEPVKRATVKKEEPKKVKKIIRKEEPKKVKKIIRKEEPKKEVKKYKGVAPEPTKEQKDLTKEKIRVMKILDTKPFKNIPLASYRGAPNVDMFYSNMLNQQKTIKGIKEVERLMREWEKKQKSEPKNDDLEELSKREDKWVKSMDWINDKFSVESIVKKMKGKTQEQIRKDVIPKLQQLSIEEQKKTNVLMNSMNEELKKLNLNSLTPAQRKKIKQIEKQKRGYESVLRNLGKRIGEAIRKAK